VPAALAHGVVRVDATSLCPVHHLRRFCALARERERERECVRERELELTACMVAALEHAEAPDQ
jgi:hypothetical protein